MDFGLDKLCVLDLLDLYEFNIVGDLNKPISNIGSLKRANSRSLLWSKRKENLEKVTFGTVICSQDDFDRIEPNNNVCYLITQRSPRLAFAKVVDQIIKNDDNNFINDVDLHRKNSNIRVGENVFIAKGVSIGDYTEIHHNVTILSNTIIGKNCIIRSNSSIATEGLGLEMDNETGLYFKFPQIGGVILEDFVEIGPNSTIRKSALDDTIIGRGTKIGSMCNIGHNCIIGMNCIFTCNVIVSGSSNIGNDVYFGVSSSIRNGISIESNSTIGQGAVITKNVPEYETWVGNPAKKIFSDKG
jgi:UDP-3-O-[3-hydroxymyristoyl] glucosamine N-acyltransferase